MYLIFLNMGLSRPHFGFFIIIFPWFIVYITISNYFLPMVVGNRKEELRVCMSSIHHSLEKAGRPARIEPVTNSEVEKAKSVLGFEPSNLRQNATALSLAPPPRPQVVMYLCSILLTTRTYY